MYNHIYLSMNQLYNCTKCTMGGCEKYLAFLLHKKMSADHDDLVEVCAVSSVVLFLNLCECDIIVLSPIHKYVEVYMSIVKAFSPCFFFSFELCFCTVIVLFIWIVNYTVGRIGNYKRYDEVEKEPCIIIHKPEKNLPMQLCVADNQTCQIRRSSSLYQNLEGLAKTGFPH